MAKEKPTKKGPSKAKAAKASDVGTPARKAKAKPAKAGKPARKAAAPKSGGGVAKELRKAVDTARRIAENPMISDIVAAGLLAAAASLSEEDDTPQNVAATGAEGTPRGSRAKAAAKAAASAMGRKAMESAKGAVAAAIIPGTKTE